MELVLDLDISMHVPFMIFNVITEKKKKRQAWLTSTGWGKQKYTDLEPDLLRLKPNLGLELCLHTKAQDSLACEIHSVQRGHKVVCQHLHTHIL